MTFAQSPAYTIRPCQNFDEFAACVTLQREVWQFSDLDVTPVRALVVNQNSGGFTLGAFSNEGGDLLGFAHALPAFDAKLQPYYYSQMVAITPVLQNSGIGMQLKLAQRESALQRGIKLMVWTFDPLQSRNAYLNLIKLGGIVRKYYVNYYGHYSTSALHRGLDTDRLLVEWWLDAPHVRAVAQGELIPRNDGDPIATVEVPFDIEQIKVCAMEEAQQWQAKIRAAFQQHLASGLYCAGFVRGDSTTPSQYLFFRDQLTK